MAKMTKIIIKTFLAFTPYPFAMLDEYRTHFRLLFSLTAVVAYKTNTLKGIFRSDYYFSTLKQGKAREKESESGSGSERKTFLVECLLLGFVDKLCSGMVGKGVTGALVNH